MHIKGIAHGLSGAPGTGGNIRAGFNVGSFGDTNLSMVLLPDAERAWRPMRQRKHAQRQGCDGFAIFHDVHSLITEENRHRSIGQWQQYRSRSHICPSNI
jgi:hypothetical protein